MNNKITINGLYPDELNTKLYDLISEIKDKFGVEGRLHVFIEDGRPNAFGGDYSGENGLYIKRGIFKIINLDNESDIAKVLIAHEFSHISHKDFTTGIKIIIAGLVAIFTVFYFVKIILLLNDPLAGLISIITLFIIGEIYFWWRRKTELRCDSEAAIITKDFKASKKLREKMSVYYANVKDTIKFSEKVRFYFKKFFYWIFLGSHPSNQKRMENLEKLEKEFMSPK